MLASTTRFFSRHQLGFFCLLGALPQLAQAQANNSQTIATSPAYGSVITVRSGTLYIGAGVTIENAAIHVTGNNVTICNKGTIKDNYSGNGYGVIDADSGVKGLEINNVGVVSAQTMKLHSAVTLRNGSADGGATLVAGATWQGSLANTCDVAPVIANYASWQAQVHALPGGTITNTKGATWNGYLTTTADLRVTNAGTWSSQIQEANGSPTITIVHNGGTWSGGVGGGSGSLRITNNANWTVGFNFPGGANNAFTTALGATTSYNGYLGLGGVVTLLNNGTTKLGVGMGTLGRGSSLTAAAGSQFDLTGDFTNEGTVANAGSIAISGNFTNNGTVTGPTSLPRARFTAGGYTVNNSRFGADGSYLDFCDAGRPNGGFDVSGGTTGRNVAYCASSSSTQALSPLPVTLTSFTAVPRAGQVLLRWTTATEQANDRFELERSTDGQRFEAVYTVAGHGTTASAQAYSYLDARPLAGLSYYRLRQVDVAGPSTYSPVVSVRLSEPGEPTALLAYPNPTAGSLQLDLRPYSAATCEVRVLNTLGQLVQHSLLPGGQVQPLALHHLPTGTYLLCLSQAGQRPTVQRIVKQ